MGVVAYIMPERYEDQSLRWRCIASLAEQVRADRHALRIIEAQQEGSRTPNDGERLNQRSAQAKVCGPRGGARVIEGREHTRCRIEGRNVGSLEAIALEAGVGRVL